MLLRFTDPIKDPMLLDKIQAADEFVKQNPNYIISKPGQEPPLNINIDRFYYNEKFIKQWKNFKNDLRDKPRETLNCLALAFYHRIILNSISEYGGQYISNIHSYPMIRVQIFNYRPIIPVSEIKFNSYGKLICTRGCVIRVGRAKDMAQWILFACNKCDNYKIVKQPDGIYTVPRKCDFCGPSKFEAKLNSAHVKTIKKQVIKLQEHLDGMHDDRGKMPRILEVELIDALVGNCVPGDDVTIVGIIKVNCRKFYFTFN